MKLQLKVLLIVIVLFSALYFFLTVLPARELERNHRFTIAQINSIESQSEGSKEAYITYKYKNRTYYGSFPLVLGYQSKFEIGGFVFIKFNPDNPENAEVDYDHLVPDSLKVPFYGWKSIPK